MTRFDNENILAAWTAIEQFSEGDIDLKANNNLKYKRLPKEYASWNQFFKTQLMTFKDKHQAIKHEDRIGLTLFFDVFSFSQLINALADKFKLSQEYQDDNNTQKFTWCVSFIVTDEDDNKFKLKEDSIFYTMSGYAHRYNDLPNQIEEIEAKLNKKIAELFENGFEQGMNQLVEEQTNFSVDNYYEFQEDITHDDVLLHSFYTDDLKLAMDKQSKNLERYLSGFQGARMNLDSDQRHSTFNAHAIAKNLAPQNYPLGRFPSNPEWGLSLMQQIAVNVSLNDDNNDVRGVNGPPGTGKTTLLKDIFAELTVRQAYEITQLMNKHLTETETYFGKGKIAQLSEQIAEYNIIVASSNNGAVQNIVKELPQKDQIDPVFEQEITDLDYFTAISNAQDKNDNQAINKNWGTFATEGGKKANVQSLTTMIQQMVKAMDDDAFKDNPRAYQEFEQQYHKVAHLRDQAQGVADTYQKLMKRQNQLNSQRAKFNAASDEKQAQKQRKIQQIEQTLDSLEQNINHNLIQQAALVTEKNNNERQIQLKKEALNVLHQQKPTWLSILFKRPKALAYRERKNTLSSVLGELLDQQARLEDQVQQFNQTQATFKKQQQAQVEAIQITKDNFDQWEYTQKVSLEKLEKKIQSLKKEIEATQIQPLDLTQPYEQLQQSNPWFSKEYRIEQSRLFIKALAVKKQFLYENKRSIKGSANIWNRLSDYTNPDKRKLITSAWNWINLAIPVISTTFASFGRMFKYMDVEDLANLFIDEAGQAVPQAAVGAILRSKRVMAVGDPSQIPPVIPLSNGVIRLIAKKYGAPKTVVNGYASVQTLIDEASQYGYQKKSDEWIGIPLWVHRRCLDPMFSISNQISYDEQMVLPENMKHPGKGGWIDITGVSENKFVKEQAEWLRTNIEKRLAAGEDAQNIYVISPFKNVVNQLKKELSSKLIPTKSIGTVHTFQGKEAKIVYLVLGASWDEAGAAQWAINEPNLMNVAATRAKEEFWVIGDKNLYQSFHSDVIETTLNVLPDSNS
ncbi:AAA domain-containing protein [Weissella kandleri]|uniref:DEAD/DEAH box helicase n=1 Tax=Weissella kandleri TaxID=1616 RepID=UPI00387ED2C9